MNSPNSSNPGDRHSSANHPRPHDATHEPAAAEQPVREARVDALQHHARLADVADREANFVTDREFVVGLESLEIEASVSTFSQDVPGGSRCKSESDVPGGFGIAGISRLRAAGGESNGDSGFPSLSADGRYVTFWSIGTNLVVGDTNARPDVFVHDRQTTTTTRVSVATGGAQVNPVSNDGTVSSISDDGRFVAFGSDATNLVAGDTNNVTDVFLHDRQYAMTTRVSVSPTWGQGDRWSQPGTISANGNAIALYSSATNFGIANPFGVAHAYLRMRDAVPDKFCFGDGTGTACPCGNNSSPGLNNGCAHSGGVGGRLLASGSASLANDTLHLNGLNQPAGTLGLFFQGTGQIAGCLGMTFGDGLLCLANITRLGVKAAPSGGSTYPATGDPTISVQGGVAAPAIRFYQLWYRDAATHCTAATYNLTNGLQVEWTP